MNNLSWYDGFGAEIVTDDFLWWSQIWSLTFGIISIVFTTFYMYSNREVKHFNNLLLPIFLGLLLMCLFLLPFINNLFVLYIYLELIAFLIYFTLYYFNINIKFILKYFIINCLSTGILLFGLSLICYDYMIFINNAYCTLFDWADYSCIGSNINYYKNVNISVIGVQFFFIGVVIKLGLFPGYIWLIAVYNSISNYSILFFLVVVIKFFYISLLFSIVVLFYNWCSILLYIVGISSFIIGAYGAIFQTRIINFIGFTSLNQIGFITLLLLLVDDRLFDVYEKLCLLDEVTYDVNETITLIYGYIIIYFICLNLFFLVLVNMRLTVNSGGSNSIPIYISDLTKASNIPSIKFLLFISYFTFSGLPPFTLFFVKFSLLYEFILNGYYFLFFIILVVSLISSLYYFRIIKLLLIEENKFNNNTFLVGTPSLTAMVSVAYDCWRYHYWAFPEDYYDEEVTPYDVSYTKVYYELFIFAVSILSFFILVFGGATFFVTFF